MYAEVRSRSLDGRVLLLERPASASSLIPKRGKCIVLYGSAIPDPRRTVRCACSPRRAVTTIVERPTYGCLVTTPECGAHSALSYNQNASRPAVVTDLHLDECCRADVPGAADAAEAMLVIGCSTKLLSPPLCLRHGGGGSALDSTSEGNGPGWTRGIIASNAKVRSSCSESSSKPAPGRNIASPFEGQALGVRAKIKCGASPGGSGASFSSASSATARHCRSVPKLSICC